MLSAELLGEYVKNKFAALRDAKLEKTGNNELTEAEGREINERLLAELKAEFANDKPTVDPELILKYYGNSVPSLKVVEGNNRQERTDFRNRVIDIYAQALVNTYGYMKGCGNKKPVKRGTQQIPVLLKPEERAAFIENCQKMESSYYKDMGMTEAQINKAIDEATKANNLVVFKTIKETVDNYKDLFENEMSDDELFRLYPTIMGQCNLLNEANSLIDEIRKNIPEGVTDEELDEYYKNVMNLMVNASKYIKKIHVYTDPYYPLINLETLFNAHPVQLNEMHERVEQTVLDPVDDEDLVEDQEKIGIIEVSKKEDLDKALKDKQPGQEYANVLYIGEYINRLPMDLWFIRDLEVENKMTSKFGLSFGNLKEAKQFCDKDGNIVDITEDSPHASLQLNKYNGILYVLDPFGEQEPVPVIVDKSSDTYKVLSGKEEIANSLNNQQEPTVSGWSRLLNGLKKTFTLGFGDTTKTMKDYYAKKSFYDLKKNLAAGKFPEAVNRIQADNHAKVQMVAEKRAEREKDAEALLKGIKHIDKNDVLAFDRALGTLLAKKGLNAEAGKFRNTIYNMLGVKATGFDEDKAISEFRENPKFREFVWKLRQENEDDLNNLRSGDKDKANAALNNIVKKMTRSFAAHNSWKKPVDKEFDDLLNAEKLVRENAGLVAEGKILSPNDEYRLKNEVDNKAYWDKIKAIYGAKRDMQVDQMKETSDSEDTIYSMSQFNDMKDNEVDLNGFKSGDHALDEETFASLGLMKNIKNSEFFSKEKPNIKDIEEQRKNLLQDLSCMDKISMRGNSEETGKQMLAKDLTASLKFYAEQLKKVYWRNRKAAATTMVADKVLKFAKENGMMGLLTANGLTEAELKRIETSIAVGKVANEAFNAETDLKLEANGSKTLSADERMECIAKMMRLKAVQVDTDCLKEQFSGVEFSDLEEKLNEDPFVADELGEHMLSVGERSKMAKEGSKTILNRINCSGQGNEGIRVAGIKGTYEAEKIRRAKAVANRDKLKTLIEKLPNKDNYPNVIKCSEWAINAGDSESIKYLVYRMEKNQEGKVLKDFDNFLKDCKKVELRGAIDKFIDNRNKENAKIKKAQVGGPQM